VKNDQNRDQAKKKKKKMNGLLVKGEKNRNIGKKRNLVIKITYQLSCTARKTLACV